MWAIACTLTGDGRPPLKLVKDVVRGTLPQPHRLRQGGRRIKIVIAATEAAAARGSVHWIIVTGPWVRWQHSVPGPRA